MKTKICRVCWCLLVVVVGLAMVLPAAADLVQLTESEFNTAVTGATTNDEFGFTEQFQSLGANYWVGTEYDSARFTTDANGGLYGSNNGYYEQCPVSQIVLCNDAYDFTVNPHYGTTATAVGLTLFSLGSSSSTIDGTVWFWNTELGSIVERFSLTAPGDITTPVFFGYASTDPSTVIDFVRFDASSGTTYQPRLASITLGTYVPEPSAVTLLTLGLLGLLAYAWRKRK